MKNKDQYVTAKRKRCMWRWVLEKKWDKNYLKYGKKTSQCLT